MLFASFSFFNRARFVYFLNIRHYFIVTLFRSLLNVIFLYLILYTERDIYALEELADTEVCRKYKEHRHLLMLFGATGSKF